MNHTQEQIDRMHDSCLPGDLGQAGAHTHEGQRGFWLFTVEVPPQAHHQQPESPVPAGTTGWQSAAAFETSRHAVRQSEADIETVLAAIDQAADTGLSEYNKGVAAGISWLLGLSTEHPLEG